MFSIFEGTTSIRSLHYCPTIKYLPIPWAEVPWREWKAVYRIRRFAELRRCLRIIRLKPLFFLSSIFFSPVFFLSLSHPQAFDFNSIFIGAYLPTIEVERCSPFLPSNFESNDRSRDRTLASFDTLSFERMKTEYLSCNVFSRVFRACCFSLFSFSFFFSFKWNCYTRFWESWDGFIGAWLEWLEKVWKKMGGKFVLGRLRWRELANYYYYYFFKMYLWSFKSWFCTPKIWNSKNYFYFGICFFFRVMLEIETIQGLSLWFKKFIAIYKNFFSISEILIFDCLYQLYFKFFFF